MFADREALIECIPPPSPKTIIWKKSHLIDTLAIVIMLCIVLAAIIFLGTMVYSHYYPTAVEHHASSWATSNGDQIA